MNKIAIIIGAIILSWILFILVAAGTNKNMNNKETSGIIFCATLLSIAVGLILYGAL